MDEVTLMQATQAFFTTKIGGVGIGLMLSTRFITAAGGSLDIRSQLDEGSTITLRLPLVKDPS